MVNKKKKKKRTLKKYNLIVEIMGQKTSSRNVSLRHVYKQTHKNVKKQRHFKKHVCNTSIKKNVC